MAVTRRQLKISSTAVLGTNRAKRRGRHLTACVATLGKTCATGHTLGAHARVWCSALLGDSRLPPQDIVEGCPLASALVQVWLHPPHTAPCTATLQAIWHKASLSNGVPAEQAQPILSATVWAAFALRRRTQQAGLGQRVRGRASL